jgi:hypothetical protein
MCDHAPNREAAMVRIAEDEKGKPTVWCDPCIAPLVKALNDAGMRTRASCCGHGTHPTSVALADGRWVFVVDAEQADAISARLHEGRTQPRVDELRAALRGDADE